MLHIKTVPMVVEYCQEQLSVPRWPSRAEALFLFGLNPVRAPPEAPYLRRVQVLSKRGADIAFAGGGSSLLAVAGADERGGAVILVDTLAPAASARIARLHGHQVCTPDGSLALLAKWHEAVLAGGSMARYRQAPVASLDSLLPGKAPIKAATSPAVELTEVARMLALSCCFMCT